ncbi:MAG TPA: T9SS type A sorting domain-containing protein, partial [Bacteroidetes bacterium]|nr:T9SS type A sorting domain-containing protein [Bacteroidota bacterium]
IGMMPLGEDGYLMAFIAIDEDSTASIGLAHSRNGLIWSVDEEPVINNGDGWMTDLFTMGQLSIFHFNDQTGLAFQGTNAMGFPQIGFGFSEDMDTWEINNELVLMPTMNAMDFDGYALLSPEVVPSGDDYEILYAGLGGNFAFSLGVAFTDGENITRHHGLEAGGAVLEPGGVGGWGEIYLVGGRYFNWGEERRMIFCGLDEGNASAIGLALQYPYLSAPESDEHQVQLPSVIMLDPAYPNPFNSSTTIRYILARNGLVQVTIRDVTGREIVSLVEGYRNAGQYSIVWNGMNGEGKLVSSGLYFVTVSGFNQSKNMKMLLVK